MAQIEQLLKYQEEDGKLLKIEQEVASSEERKKYVQAKNFLTKAPEKLDQLEAKANELNAVLQQLTKRYEEICETLKDFENLDELIEGGADVSFYKKNVSSISSHIKSLKTEINELVAKIKTADEDYQTLKKKTIAVQKQYKDASETYKAYKDSKLKEMQVIQAELQKIEKDLKAEVISKYKEKRSERIYPVICSATKEGRCSKCGNELSIAGKESINSGNVIECEHCHRLLYKAK
ncbi:MAG: hypothetical protein J6B04_00495, partial [Clostridia bacterium]|nr:hypothetical protein [Clostridia bacterium]